MGKNTRGRIVFMQIIGITGISGAGKSTVADAICKRENAESIDADKIVKVCQRKGEEYYKKIVEIFGKDILQESRRTR